MEQRSLVGRAVVAVALMICFYLLAVGVAGGLLALVWLEAVELRRLSLQLAIPCVVGACVILASIAPRRVRFVAPGPRLEEREHPRLFEWLRSIARDCGEPMPADVYLLPIANAFVASRGGVMGLGSTRVMGIGLPFLLVESKRELASCIAHEFGHLHGGDVALGPWIHSTRLAIGRTLERLRKRPILHAPFRAYGLFFLRVTHAISRSQELAADALGVRVGGTRAHVASLQKSVSSAALFDAFWSQEVAPVLGRGFRPPLQAGFERFLATPRVSSAAKTALDERMKSAKQNPYDTHPSLAERVAHAQRLPSVATPADDEPAWKLLGDVTAAERALLDFVGGKKAASLRPIEWDEVAEKVVLPTMRDTATQCSRALQGRRVADLPELVRSVSELATKLATTFPKLPHPQRELVARRALLCSFGAALHRRGFQLHTSLGEPVTFRRDGTELDPTVELDALHRATSSAPAWREKLVALGVADEPLAPAAPRDASGSARPLDLEREPEPA